MRSCPGAGDHVAVARGEVGLTAAGGSRGRLATITGERVPRPAGLGVILVDPMEITAAPHARPLPILPSGKGRRHAASKENS
jgi:hypothetical protein